MRIIIEEGATFIGKSEVTPAKTATNARSVTPSADSSRKSQPAESAA